MAANFNETPTSSSRSSIMIVLDWYRFNQEPKPDLDGGKAGSGSDKKV